jgi:hypothetical protein
LLDWENICVLSRIAVALAIVVPLAYFFDTMYSKMYRRAANTGFFYMTCIWLKTLKRGYGVVVI